MYKVELTSKAQKSIRRADKSLRLVFEQKIKNLRNDPYNAEYLGGDLKHWWSYHFTHRGIAYRIIYRIYKKEKLLLISLADTRENIYKELRRRK